ncbi:TetR family transcriptional regulator C-terminal domain-containing protein [Paraburkholderia sp. MPAMCS5]|uniref:TetR/AcrR family transcriptional regulator n=1 Tax=Paraburkholderia sp. MPAMCS5 TaxID=3112563 RepID=UPI002E19CFAE|nr:TetR family transcriptional regulator C-terminal domain-containing protein [Paraburkholderia sp. MPAMCS5]
MNTAARRGPKPNPHTRDELLSAGLRMLHAGGYSATGIQEIVDKASVPKGSFYNHFDSKEAFGAEVVDCYFNRSLSELQPLFRDNTLSPLERLQAYFDKRIRSLKAAGYVRGCLMGNLSLEVADHSAAIRERIAANFKTWTGLLEECIAAAQSTGEIRNQLPATMLAQFLLNSWEGALLRMRVEKSDVPLKEFREVIFHSVLV